MATSTLDWSALLKHYVDDLDGYWPAPRRRQGRKLETLLERFQKTHGIVDRAAALTKVIALAKTRSTERPQTVFLMSPGSSGSHWLERVLNKSHGLAPCGEVYLPRSIRKILRDLSAQERAMFIDSIHIIHAEHPAEGLEHAKFVNSSHQSGWKLAETMEEPKITILLLRDPADIAISRTFRKPSYRDRFGSIETQDLLEQNISYVTRFFETAASAYPDITVKFEDMRNDLGAVIRQISDNIGVAVPDDILSKTVADLGYVPQSEASRKDRKTNLYVGPKMDIPDDVRVNVNTQLSSLRQSFGYA